MYSPGARGTNLRGLGWQTPVSHVSSNPRNQALTNRITATVTLVRNYTAMRAGFLFSAYGAAAVVKSRSTHGIVEVVDSDYVRDLDINTYTPTVGLNSAIEASTHACGGMPCKKLVAQPHGQVTTANHSQFYQSHDKTSVAVHSDEDVGVWKDCAHPHPVPYSSEVKTRESESNVDFPSSARTSYTEELSTHTDRCSEMTAQLSERHQNEDDIDWDQPLTHDDQLHMHSTVSSSLAYTYKHGKRKELVSVNMSNNGVGVGRDAALENAYLVYVEKALKAASHPDQLLEVMQATAHTIPASYIIMALERLVYVCKNMDERLSVVAHEVYQDVVVHGVCSTHPTRAFSQHSEAIQFLRHRVEMGECISAARARNNIDGRNARGDMYDDAGGIIGLLEHSVDLFMSYVHRTSTDERQVRKGNTKKKSVRHNIKSDFHLIRSIAEIKTNTDVEGAHLGDLSMERNSSFSTPDRETNPCGHLDQSCAETYDEHLCTAQFEDNSVSRQKHQYETWHDTSIITRSHTESDRHAFTPRSAYQYDDVNERNDSSSYSYKHYNDVDIYAVPLPSVQQYPRDRAPTRRQQHNPSNLSPHTRNEHEHRTTHINPYHACTESTDTQQQQTEHQKNYKKRQYTTHNSNRTQTANTGIYESDGVYAHQSADVYGNLGLGCEDARKHQQRRNLKDLLYLLDCTSAARYTPQNLMKLVSHTDLAVDHTMSTNALKRLTMALKSNEMNRKFRKTDLHLRICDEATRRIEQNVHKMSLSTVVGLLSSSMDSGINVNSMVEKSMGRLASVDEWTMLSPDTLCDLLRVLIKVKKVTPLGLDTMGDQTAHMLNTAFERVLEHKEHQVKHDRLLNPPNLHTDAYAHKSTGERNWKTRHFIGAVDAVHLASAVVRASRSLTHHSPTEQQHSPQSKHTDNGDVKISDERSSVAEAQETEKRIEGYVRVLVSLVTDYALLATNSSRAAESYKNHHIHADAYEQTQKHTYTHDTRIAEEHFTCKEKRILGPVEISLLIKAIGQTGSLTQLQLHELVQLIGPNLDAFGLRVLTKTSRWLVAACLKSHLSIPKDLYAHVLHRVYHHHLDELTDWQVAGFRFAFKHAGLKGRLINKYIEATEERELNGTNKLRRRRKNSEYLLME
eukprot:CFRG5990T1